MQGTGSSIRGPNQASEGGSIEIQVQGGSPTVEVGLNGHGVSATYPVPANGKVTIPIPPGSAGRTMFITTTGRPPLSFLRVEIISSD